MGVLQRFERRLEGVVSGAFARAFKAEVQPIEIAAALQRELDSNAKILSRDRSLVPNSFCVELGPYDYARLSPHERRLTVELAELVREHADAQHYGFSGPVRVTLAQRDDLGTGQFRLCSDVVAGVDRAATYAPTDTAPQRAVAFLEVNGESHPVLAPGLVLGRSSESDLRIEDPGISREHAEIRVHSNDGGAQVVLVDLGSTNGSMVDGARVAEAELVDGSQIMLGSTELVVRIPEQGVREISELTLTVIKLGFLVVLWLFVLSTVSAIRADLFGARPSQPRDVRPPKPAKQPKPPRRAHGAPSRLVVVDGPDRGHEVRLLGGPVVVGRGPECTLPVSDEYVSTQHARLVPQDGRWYVEDLGSTNGTVLFGQRINGAVEVGAKTPIKLGKTVLELRK